MFPYIAHLTQPGLRVVLKGLVSLEYLYMGTANPLQYIINLLFICKRR